MTKVTPILIFAGQASQAIELYRKAFFAEVKVNILYSEANPKDFDFEYKDEYKDLVYHAQIMIGKQLIMVADDYSAVQYDKGDKTPDKSFLIDLVIEYDSDDDMKAAYEVLSDGATITTPLCSQTYCSLCVALIDRFGGRWQLMSYGK